MRTRLQKMAKNRRIICFPFVPEAVQYSSDPENASRNAPVYIYYIPVRAKLFGRNYDSYISLQYNFI